MKVSIIIRAFNNEKTLERAIKSSLGQNYPEEDFEVVVVNDGSTDKTLEIIKKFASVKNLRIVNQENQGHAQAANTGILSSQGDYIVFLDGDDEFDPDLLSQEAEVLDSSSSVDFVYFYYIEEYKGNKKTVSPKNIFESVMIGVMMRRKRVLDEGLYNPNITFIEYDLFLRTLGKWNGQHINKSLFTYHRDTQSITAKQSKVIAGIKELEELHPNKLIEISQIRSYLLPKSHGKSY